MEFLLGVVVVAGITALVIWATTRKANKEEVAAQTYFEPTTVETPKADVPPFISIVTAETPVEKEEKKRYKQGAKKPTKKKTVKKPAKKTKKTDA